jgi:hypothetical protein
MESIPLIDEIYFRLLKLHVSGQLGKPNLIPAHIELEHVNQLLISACDTDDCSPVCHVFENLCFKDGTSTKTCELSKIALQLHGCSSILL